MIIILIPSLISNNVKCVDKTTLNDIDLICLIKKEKGNNTEYYFDSFSYYFEQLWKNDRNIGMNILYLFLFLIRIILNSLRILYSILIIKNLNTEFYLCSWEIFYSIIKFLL